MSVAQIEYAYAKYITVECQPHDTIPMFKEYRERLRPGAIFLGVQVGDWGPEKNGSRKAKLEWMEAS